MVLGRLLIRMAMFDWEEGKLVELGEGLKVLGR